MMCLPISSERVETKPGTIRGFPGTWQGLGMLGGCGPCGSARLEMVGLGG
jgi:hypothetical protein